MASTFQLEIVTPDRKFYDDQVEMVIVRTPEGDTGILKNHIPTVTPLSIGIIKIKKDGKLVEASCAAGFVSIDEDKTTVITDAAEWPEEIDITRAESAAKRAEERMKKDTDNIDLARAEIALRKALTRLRIARDAD